MTDQEIIQGLIDRDEKITRDFFFRRCQVLPKNQINWMVIQMALPYGTKL